MMDRLKNNNLTNRGLSFYQDMILQSLVVLPGAKLSWHTFIKYNNFLKLKKKSFMQFQIAFLGVFILRTAGEYEQVQAYFYFPVNPKCLSFAS